MVNRFLKEKNFILYSFIKVLVAFSEFWVTIILVKKLDVKVYGTYSILLTFTNLCLVYWMSWVIGSLSVFGTEEKEKKGSMYTSIRSINKIGIYSGIILLIIIFIFNNIIESYLGVKVNILIILSIILNTAVAYLNMYLISDNKQIYASIMMFITKMSFALGLIIFDLNINKILFIQILSNLLFLLFVRNIDKKDIKVGEFDKTLFNEILRFSLMQLVGYTGIYIVSSIDVIVIKSNFSNYEVGIYNSAYRIFNGIISLSYIFTSYYTPKHMKYLANNDYLKLKEYYTKTMKFFIIISTTVTLLIFIFSKQIITLLFGESYIKSSNVFAILTFGLIIRYIAIHYYIILNIFKEVKIIQFANIIQAIFNILLDLIFIKYLGILGPAFATVISLLISNIIIIVYGKKNIRKVLL